MRRSQLYVPGNNEKMILKSLSLGADSVILDLEDAVPANQKENARKLVMKVASELEWGRRELCIRVNSPTTAPGKGDLTQLRNAERVDSIVIPKAEGDLSPIHKSTGKSLIPIIETAKGLHGIDQVVRSKGVDAVSLGVADFALSVSGSIDGYLDNTYLKTRIAVAARAYGVDPVDNVFFDLKDPEGFKRQAMNARALGFAGKQVIHPSQIDIANQVFSPTAAELRHANRVVAAYEKTRRRGRGALSLDGQLVDEVHYRLAKRILGNPRA